MYQNSERRGVGSSAKGRTPTEVRRLFAGQGQPDRTHKEVKRLFVEEGEEEAYEDAFEWGEGEGFEIGRQEVDMAYEHAGHEAEQVEEDAFEDGGADGRFDDEEVEPPYHEHAFEAHGEGTGGRHEDGGYAEEGAEPRVDSIECDDPVDCDTQRHRDEPVACEEPLLTPTPRHSARRRPSLHGVPPASTGLMFSSRAAVREEQVDEEEDVLEDGPVVYEESLVLTPRRSARRRSLLHGVPLSSPRSAKFDEPVDGEQPAIREERTESEDPLLLTPRRSARRHSYSQDVPPATTRPVSSVRSAERPVAVKEEPREVQGPASAPAKIKPKPKKRRSSGLSEVLRLQKSLETAQWTNSRAISRQTEVIVISDDDAPLAKGKAVLLKRKAMRESGSKPGATVKTERVEETKTRTLRSSAKKEVVKGMSMTRKEHESAKVDRPGQTEESRPTSDDERPGDVTKNQSKGKPTKKRKANPSTKKSQRKEPETVGGKDVKVQNKAKQKSDKGEKQTASNVAGQKRRSSSGHVINKRARLARPDDSIKQPVEAMTLNGDVSRRTSPRHVKGPDEAVTVAIAKSKSAPKASKSSKGPGIIKPLHDRSRESKTISSLGKKGTADKRAATGKRLKTHVGIASPTRKVVGRPSASPRDIAKANGHMPKKQAVVEADEPLKRRRKGRPRKHTESSSDVLAESMEDLRRFDGNTGTASQRKTSEPKSRQNSALKDSRARRESASGERGLKAKTSKLQKEGFPGPPSSTKRVRSRIAHVPQRVVNVAPSITESDMTAVGTKGWDVDGDSIYAVAQPPPKRRGKERRRMQPVQVEMNDMKSPDKTGEKSPNWGTPENLRANYRRAVVAKAPKLQLDADEENDVETSSHEPQNQTDLIPAQSSEEEFDDDSGDDESVREMDLEMIVHGWVLECKARRIGLDGLGPQEMDEILRSPFGLGEWVDHIIPEMGNASVSVARHGQQVRAEMPSGSRGMHSDAERTYSSGLSDEDINRREASTGACLLE